MLADLIAARYSKALFRAAQAGKALDQVGPQAAILGRALSGPGAVPFLADPLAEPAAKLAALSSAFGGELHPVLGSFLDAVLRNKRDPYLPAMLAAFDRLRDEAEGRVRAELGTARTLKPRELDLLREDLSKRLKREVVLLPFTDESLLGGAVLKLGDTVFDGSLRGGLERLGRLLKAEPEAKAAPKAAAGPKPSAKQAKAPVRPSAKPKSGAKAAAAPKAKAKARPSGAGAKPRKKKAS